MARRKLSDELKSAIAQLPSREKDKLLFRLIAKEPDLAEKLTFQLLEGGETKEERRELLQRHIQEDIEYSERDFYSPGYLLLELRSISGAVNRHVKVTGDKYGEVALNFFMLNYTLELMGERIQRFRAGKRRTFDNYIIKRARKLQRLLGKMHDDLLLDFESDMKTLGELLKRDPSLVKLAGELGLSIEALEQGALPGEE